MQCKLCVIRVVENDMKYYIVFWWNTQESLDNNHNPTYLHFLHFSSEIYIYFGTQFISSGCWICLSKALHISYLISWDLHCVIWAERKFSMFIIIIIQCVYIKEDWGPEAWGFSRLVNKKNKSKKSKIWEFRSQIQGVPWDS